MNASASVTSDFSIVIPCYNEVDGIRPTIEEIREKVDWEGRYEIVIVNDGSSDGTDAVLEQIKADFDNITVVEHERNRGYGAALKTGINRAAAEIIVITDADGTYPNERIPDLVRACDGNDMVVGARTADDVQYSKIRAIPKFFLKRWVSWIARQNVPDINSGLRAFRKSVARTYFGILPNSFSFTITITLAMLTNYRPVLFVPISYHPRVGKSKIKPIRDTLRFSMLIIRTGTYFAPIRAFLPIIAFIFGCSLVSLCYDVFVLANLTDKTVLLFLFSMNFVMFALLADMIDKRSN